MLIEEFNCFKVSEKWLDVFVEFILISLHLKFTGSVIGKTATPLSDIKPSYNAGTFLRYYYAPSLYKTFSCSTRLRTSFTYVITHKN